jgi:hypothetical protein
MRSNRRTIAILACVSGLTASLPSAKAQNDAASALLAAHRGAIEYGTGFLFQTPNGPRIITAGHVIGPDSRWDSLLDRCIYYRLAQNGSSSVYDCVTDAKIDPTLDLAEIYLDPFAATSLKMASGLPSQNADLAVTSWRSWSQPGTRATAQAARILDVTGDKIILSGNYVRSDSGSPVLDSNGRVVGLMIEATNEPGGTTKGVAIPVTRFASILSGPAAVPIARKAIPSMAELGGAKPTSSAAVDAIEIAVSGCVFLGKRSARITKRTPDMPFGLATLQTLLDADKRGSLVGTTLSPEIGVNLRSDCPVVESGSAYYSPARVQLKPGDRVTPAEILALNYLDDVFFWARVTALGGGSGSNRR